jgi:hypothetical protein
MESKLPEFKRAKIELWKYLDVNEIESLLKCAAQSSSINDYDLCKDILSTKLQLNKKSDKDLIIIDKYYYLIKFCVQQNFDKEQTSAIIYTINSLHNLMKSTAYGNIDQCYDYLKQTIILFSVHRPPFSLRLFEPNEAKILLDYIVNTYLKHFKLYKLVYTPAIMLDLKFQYSNIESEVDTLAEIVEEPVVVDQKENEINIEVVLNNQQDENKDLKAFIKQYLMRKIDKAKEIVELEIKEQENEINKKLNTTSRPQTQPKGVKKTK